MHGIGSVPWSVALRLGAKVRQRKTDYGTVFLHRLTVIALSVGFFTGLRIAAETPERTWINQFDLLIPYERVRTTHLQAAAVLLAVSAVKSGTPGTSDQSILKWNEVA